MQIHELDSFAGTPSSTDYLAIDNGSNTLKIPATSVGVSTSMTQSEAQNGTNTNPRVISPYRLKQAINYHAPIPNAMTANEAEAGTETETRVISPKVFKDSVEAIAGTTENTQITLTASGVSAPSTLYKYGKVVMLSIQIGNGTALSSLTGVDTIGTLPEGYRPPAQRIFPISARNVGGWATATYYNALISIDQTGTISLRGKASELKQAQYLAGAVTYIVQ